MSTPKIDVLETISKDRPYHNIWLRLGWSHQKPKTWHGYVVPHNNFVETWDRITQSYTEYPIGLFFLEYSLYIGCIHLAIAQAKLDPELVLTLHKYHQKQFVQENQLILYFDPQTQPHFRCSITFFEILSRVIYLPEYNPTEVVDSVGPWIELYVLLQGWKAVPPVSKLTIIASKTTITKLNEMPISLPNLLTIYFASGWAKFLNLQSIETSIKTSFKSIYTADTSHPIQPLIKKIIPIDAVFFRPMIDLTYTHDHIQLITIERIFENDEPFVHKSLLLEEVPSKPFKSDKYYTLYNVLYLIYCSLPLLQHYTENVYPQSLLTHPYTLSERLVALKDAIQHWRLSAHYLHEGGLLALSPELKKPTPNLSYTDFLSYFRQPHLALRVFGYQKETIDEFKTKIFFSKRLFSDIIPPDFFYREDLEIRCKILFQAKKLSPDDEQPFSIGAYIFKYVHKIVQELQNVPPGTLPTTAPVQHDILFITSTQQAFIAFIYLILVRLNLDKLTYRDPFTNDTSTYKDLRNEYLIAFDSPILQQIVQITPEQLQNVKQPLDNPYFNPAYRVLFNLSILAHNHYLKTDYSPVKKKVAFNLYDFWISWIYELDPDIINHLTIQELMLDPPFALHDKNFPMEKHLDETIMMNHLITFFNEQEKFPSVAFLNYEKEDHYFPKLAQDLIQKRVLIICFKFQTQWNFGFIYLKQGEAPQLYLIARQNTTPDYMANLKSFMSQAFSKTWPEFTPTLQLDFLDLSVPEDVSEDTYLLFAMFFLYCTAYNIVDLPTLNTDSQNEWIIYLTHTANIQLNKTTFNVFNAFVSFLNPRTVT